MRWGEEVEAPCEPNEINQITSRLSYPLCDLTGSLVIDSFHWVEMEPSDIMRLEIKVMVKK